jgi:recombinational DNA repair protein RecR
VQYLLRHPGARRELVEQLQTLGSSVHQCPDCRRFHASPTPLCGLIGRAKQLVFVFALLGGL